MYSASMALGDFWKVEHVWDCPDEVCRMRLQRVHGYLFGNSGELTQEFVNVFDLATGYYMSGWARLIDGTYRQDAI